MKCDFCGGSVDCRVIKYGNIANETLCVFCREAGGQLLSRDPVIVTLIQHVNRVANLLLEKINGVV
jgi:hypothetical protein